MHRPSSLYSRHQPCKSGPLLGMTGCFWVLAAWSLRAGTSALEWYQQQSGNSGLAQLFLSLENRGPII